ncbi:MAG: LacI family transcriptional regulator [Clostridiales bacterium]|nr:LacI family transcriptional regulator [Clostridiales bacterium]
MTNRRSTIRDVAKMADVSISVVSYVLNETPGKSISWETAQRVRKAAAALRYTPNRIAQSMRLGYSNMIAFVSFWQMTEFVTQQIMSGVYEVAREAGYQLVLICPRQPDDTADYIDPYLRNQIDGMLLLEPFSYSLFDEAPHREAILRNRIPAVTINGLGASSIANIPISVENTTYAAVNYFVRKGYRTIEYVTPNETEANFHFTISREIGYRQAIRESGLSERMYHAHELPARLAARQDGETLALVVSKSNYIGETLSAIRAADLRIPEDVAVVVCSYEPNYLMNQVPSISYVRVPTYEIGQESCRHLLSLIGGNTHQTGFIPEPEVCEMESG